MVTEDEMRRLTFIKYLYGIGVEQSREHQPRASASILTFHDGVELFLQLVLEHLNAVPKGNRVNSFEEYFKLVEAPAIGVILASKIAMLRLNTIRIGLKHHANLPASDTISELQGRVGGFFEDNTQAIFGIEFADVSMLRLIRFDDTRAKLMQAEELMRVGQYQDALGPIALAFVRLIDEFESPQLDIYGESPYPGKLHSRLAGGGESENELELVALQDTVKIIGLGLNYVKFVRFRGLTPFIMKNLQGEYDVFTADDSDYPNPYRSSEYPSERECRFCFDFVVESALRLQEFDF